MGYRAAVVIVPLAPSRRSGNRQPWSKVSPIDRFHLASSRTAASQGGNVRQRKKTRLAAHPAGWDLLISGRAKV